MDILAWGVVAAILSAIVFGLVVSVRDLFGDVSPKPSGSKAAPRPNAPEGGAAAPATPSKPAPAPVTPSVSAAPSPKPTMPAPAPATPSTPAPTVAVTPSAPKASAATDNFVGESLVGEGDEVAHIDLVIGSKSGEAGEAFAKALANQKNGFTTLLAVVAPNLPAKPDTLLFNKVTIKGAAQAVQMFGPAQAAVARAVVDSVESGVIPRDRVDDYCVLVGVFIHWDAKDNQKIYDYNYRATKEAIQRALARQPSVDDGIARAKTALHPFASGAEGRRP